MQGQHHLQRYIDVGLVQHADKNQLAKALRVKASFR
jgi:hypothetical protein